MLIKMHKYSKYILIGILVLIIPAFVLWGGGGGGSPEGPITGFIFGKPVDSNEYSSSLRGAASWQIISLCLFYKVQNYETILANKQVLESIISQESALRKEAWNRLLFEKEAGDMGILVSDKEVTKWIARFPLFQTSGRFAEDKFNTVLRFLFFNSTQSGFIKELKRSLLIEKLQNLITTNIMVTDSEAEKYYIKENEKRDLSFLSFPYKNYVDKVSCTGEEIEQYYKNNKELFRVDEKVKVDYITLEINDKDPTINITNAEKEAFYSKNKERFRKKDNSLKTFDECKEDISKTLTMKRASDLVSNKLTDIFFDIDSGKLSAEEAAKKHNVQLQKSDFFTRFESIKGISNPIIFARVAFTTEINKVSAPVFLGNEFVILIPRVKMPSKIPPFDNCKNRAEESLKISKAKKIAYKEAGVSRKRMEEKIQKTPDTPLENIAKELGFAIETSKSVSASSKTQAGDESPQFNNVAFSIGENILSEPIEIMSGTVILWITNTVKPDMSAFEKKKENYREKVVREKQQIVYYEWHKNLEKKADIQDLTIEQEET
ncbi:MAG: SurA N-terminal domain-containing protein [Candidatus Aureabacteria bacterium]|nr:SurA N-terminal domain-containing protein [Candidatus Auribacterota bacterium]MCK5160855.1 SurA N-terminal domain-containing protein [Candidatus Auribacterota bacterium]